MLTPIRVRGRRNRSTNKKEKTTTTAENINDGVAVSSQPRRPKGRPMMSFELKSSSQTRTAEKRRQLAAAASRNQIKQRGKASLLECLPVELIEKIFLHSLDINLPRASPALAAAISSERMYRVLILLSFWSDFHPHIDNKGSRAEISRTLRLADYVPLGHEERIRLQSDILRCRWCTLQRIQAQLPDLMRMTVQKYWFGAGITMDETQRDALTRFLERKEDVRTFEGTGPGPDKKRYVLSIEPLVSVSVYCRDTGRRETHRVLSVSTFPNKLLRGEDGFKDDDVAYLEMLRHAYGNFTDFNPEDISFSRDDLQQGIHNALIANNARALTTLLKIDEYFSRRRIATGAIAPAGPSVAADMRYYSLPAEHFRTAVHVAGHDPTFFQLLLRANAESVPPDDPDITEWAMELESGDHHADLGRWLLDFMTRLPRDIEAARENPRDQAVFYMGAANRNVEMGRRYLHEVLQTSMTTGAEEQPELPSWMGEILYDVSSQWIPGSGSESESSEG
jgi:hypothetical protein